MPRHLIRALAVTALAALAACSGGGGTLPRSSSATAGSGPSTGAPSALGHATLTYTRLATAAGTAESSSKRSTRELSAGANSLVIDAAQTGAQPYHAVYDISGGVIGNGVTCTADVSGIYVTCSMQVRLPIGNDTLTVSTNTARDGSGTTLGSATIPVTIVDAQDNPIAIRLDGAVASMKLFAADPAPPTGTGANIALIVQLYDASNTVLIAPQNYTQPVSVTDNDTSGSSSLYTLAMQNSTQRYNGTSPANTSPSPTAKTVSVPDRYTVAYVSYNGASSSPFTVTATFGNLTATATISPSAPAARTAGSGAATHNLANTVRSYDPIYDSTGQLWVTQTGGKIASIDASYTVTGTYTVTTASVTRSLRAPVLGPDGAFYMDSATVSNGVATAPYYVTRFDPSTHAFTDYTTNDQVLHLTVANGSIVGAERTIGKVWTLPFSGTTPGTPAEFTVSTPAGVTDTTPALLPLPTRVYPSGDGNLWVVETSYAAVNGTYLAKYSPTGTKLSETPVDPQHPDRELDAQAYDAAHGSIWFVDLRNLNEFVRDDVASGTLTTIAVPRLYGYDSYNEFTQYEVLDTNGNLFFVSYLDNRIGRVDRNTGRAELLNAGVAGNNTYGMALAPNGTTIVVAGYGSAALLLTLNT
jgi:streptogramin lyase